ncbi:unnamed protein product [Bursaphelenchus xylophilus]|uniref:(pine wood nematode) hypothetical protein n=1 Tax=Bursaphelenchus xylophilus TaxID=6326 RepID=A0A1I7ST58_BURXY|nr:unnamed protein product [Bursaphelenchus xylophilus]CAG9108709.1 unnamed protein product [Bursaphelenchus xylophilus]
MNLSWAEKLAKNALLTAQKRIDSVLDIKAEENEEGERLEKQVAQAEDGPEDETSNSPTAELSENIEEEGEEEEPPSEYQDATEQVEPLFHVDLPEQHEEDWAQNFSPLAVNKEDIVEAEPNPIRDAHGEPSTSLIHYSPSSNSPDEEECQRSEPNEPQEETNQIDLSCVKDTDTVKEEHREDVVTVASSDIVVIRNVDDWSLASGSHRRAVSDQMSIIGNNGFNHGDGYDETLHEKISALEAKIKHRDQRITELSHQNEKLKIQNTNLIQKNKSINNKLGAESKLQKKLAEKENELAELMEEGKNLSILNGKQAKELKRLKDIEKDFESQRNLLQDAMDNIHTLTDVQERLERENSSLKQKLGEQQKEFEELKTNLNMKKEAQEDLKLAEQRCQSQKCQIAQLEQRVDELMTAQREAAEQIAISNAPLHARIEELEAELKESHSSKYVIQKKLRFADENIENLKKKMTDEITILKQQLTSLRRQNKEFEDKVCELQREKSDLIEEISNLKTLSNSMETDLLEEINGLKNQLYKKEEEIADLKCELISAHQNPVEKAVIIQQNDPDIVERIGELEREASNLRIKYKELEEAHDTLLLIHGEGTVKLEELEQENQEIKKFCKEQTLLLAKLND